MHQRSLGGLRWVWRMVAMFSLLLIGWPPAHAVVLPSGTTITNWTPIAVDDINIIVPTPFDPPGTPIFADFNGDGKVDLLVQALNASGTTYLFLADTNGKYTTIAQSWQEGHLGLKWGSESSTLWVSDYNGDGRADILLESKLAGGKNGLIYSGSSSAPFTVADQLWNNLSTPVSTPTAAITITTWTPVFVDDIMILVPTPFNPPGIRILADFNGDGKVDLLVQALDASGTTYLFLADGNGKYTAISQSWKNGHLNLDWSADKSTLWVSDYNGDGRADIIIEPKAVDGLNALLYTGSGANPINSVAQSWDNTPPTPPVAVVTPAIPQAPSAVGATVGSFDVSPSGAASYSMPIAVPPGINGLAPNLSLNYTSQAGNGIAGVGWSLGGLSVIHRCPRTIAQDGAIAGVDFSASDKFCLDGQRLVPIGSIDGGTEYRTEIESYHRVVAYGGRAGDPSYFKVWGKDGKVVQYGVTADARIEAQGRSDSAAMVWAINRITDLKGNSVTFSYTENSAIGEFTLHRIDYGGNRSVRLSYATRADTSLGYEAGSKVSSTQRLTNIKTHVSEGVEGLVRDYRLGYQAGSFSSRSHLNYVQECTPNSCLAATLFRWQQEGIGIGGKYSSSVLDWGHDAGRAWVDFDGDGRSDYCRVVGDNNGSSSKVSCTVATSTGFGVTYPSGVIDWGYDAGRQWVDFNGDGRADYCRVVGDTNGTSSKVSCTVSTGTGFGTTYTSSVIDWGYAEGRQWSDFNGDGKADYCRVVGDTNGTSSKVSCTVSTGTGFGATYSSGVIDWGYAEGRQWVDFNGDGKADYCRLVGNTNNVSSSVSCTVSTATGFGTTYSSGVIDWGYPSGRQWTDYNGDGKADFCRLVGDTNNVSSGISCTVSTGIGFGATYSSEVIDWGFDTGRDWIDFNHDGKADYCRRVGYINNVSSTVTCTLATSTGFGVTLQSATVDWGYDAGRSWADVNGDGKLDYVRLIGAANNTSSQLLVTPGLAPYPDLLLTTITTGLGAQTTISYKPLTDTYNPSTMTGTYTKYANGIPGDTVDVQAALYVVASHSVTNGIGGNNSVTHRYEGLKSKLNGRGSLGFAKIIHKDVTANITTEINYSQTFPTTGLPTSVITKVGSVIVSNTTTTYASLTPSSSTGSDGVTRYVAPYAKTVTDKKYEVDGAATTTTVTTSTPNRYGSIKTVNVTTSGNSKSFTKAVANTYLHELTTDPALSDWYKIAQVQTATATNTIPRQWSDSYSQGAGNSRKSSFTYHPDGLLQTETIEPDNTSLKQITSYGYDSFGNRTSVTISGAGLATPRTSTTTYSPDGLFPVTSTNALGHSETRTFDSRFGTVQSLTGPNGLTTTFYVDEFGRATGEVRADGTASMVAYNFCTSCATYETYSITRSATATPTTTAYYDKLGREIRSTTQGFDGRLSTKTTAYNAKGQVDNVSLPYYVGETKYLISYTYDALGRTLSETVPATANVAQRLTSTAYAPFKTTTTNGRGYPQVRLSNALGQLTSVQDVDPIAPSTLTPIETRYDYDYFGNLRYVRDPNGNVTRTYFDLRGRKIAMDDLDMGHWEYEYNAVGELIKQWDAKTGRNTTGSVAVNALALPTTRMEYDALGRLIKRTEAEGVSQWLYDSAPMGKGKLASVTGPGGYVRSHSYDSLGRPTRLSTTIGADTFTQETRYDSYGRIDTTLYPETRPGVRLGVTNVYTSSGYLSQVKNRASGQLYWQAGQHDAAGRLTQESFGNGLTTTHTYDPQHGYQLDIKTGVGVGSTSIQNLSYRYDVLGNLQGRTVGLPELSRSYSESFTYDAYNRLTEVTASGGPANKSYRYDILGNIKLKSDTAAEYVYGDAKHLHAVTQLKNSAGGLIATYSYDANGNMIVGNGRTTAHTSYNLPWNIIQGGNAVTFLYDADHQRMQQISNDEVTTYLSPRLDTGTHFEKSHRTSTGVIEYKHYIYGGNGPAAIYTVATNSATPTLRYLHKDHLGSIEAISDETGKLKERLSYDPFGKRRNANGSDGAVTPQTTDHGFTGHEMLDSVGLVHMNGRVYDPQLGRFIEADPYIQAPTNSQSYNRYSYAMNNPLSLVDPSGYFSLRQFVAVVVGAVVTYYTGNPALGGFVQGLIAGKGDIKAGVTGAISAIAFNVVGGIVGQTQSWSMSSFAGNVGRMAAQGAVGGYMSVVQGGQFRDGFIGAALAKGGEGFIGGIQGEDSVHVIERTLMAGTVGGIGSRLAGGSFDQGFATAAFVHLYNAEGHRGGRGPVQQGLDGESAFDSMIEESGGKIRGRQITLDFQNSEGATTRVRIDRLWTNSAGEYYFTEVKNGPAATLTTNQGELFNQLQRNGYVNVTPRGARATATGVTPPGTPMRIGGGGGGGFGLTRWNAYHLLHY